MFKVFVVLHYLNHRPDHRIGPTKVVCLKRYPTVYFRVLALFLMANGLFVSERGRAAPEPAPEADAAGDPFGTADALLWVLVAGQAAAYGLDLWDQWPIGRSLVGPNYDPESIDAPYLLDPIHGASISLPYREETVPTSTLALAAVGSLGLLNGLVAVSPEAGNWRKYHDVSMGLSMTLFTTITATEILKRAFGRLRPDFQDRFLARGCQGALNVPKEELPCDEVPPELRDITADDYDYGRRSFPSGHASTSFALGTYAGLFLVEQGLRVWDTEPAVAWTSFGGAAAAWGLASFVAASRVTDHRHHPEDVVAGGLIGTAVAAASYFWVGGAQQNSWQVGFEADGQSSGLVRITGGW